MLPAELRLCETFQDVFVVAQTCACSLASTDEMHCKPANVHVCTSTKLQVSGFLEKGADGLCTGGKMGIFTPMYLCVCRKPLQK